MDHCAGLDVSVNETSVCIVDDSGRIIREVKVASEPGALLQVLKTGSYRFKHRALYRLVDFKEGGLQIAAASRVRESNRHGITRNRFRLVRASRVASASRAPCYRRRPTPVRCEFRPRKLAKLVPAPSFQLA
jgi:hypothetical protein